MIIDDDDDESDAIYHRKKCLTNVRTYYTNERTNERKDGRTDGYVTDPDRRDAMSINIKHESAP